MNNLSLIKVTINPKISVASGAQPVEAYLHSSTIIGLKRNANIFDVIVKPEYLPVLQARFFGQNAAIESIKTNVSEIE